MVSRPLRQPKAFTTKYNGRSSVLENEVQVAAALGTSTDVQSALDAAKKYKAVWDTGATNSVITQTVVDECGLSPTGIAEVYTAQGTYNTETYLVSLFLPNHVYIPTLVVSRGVLHGNSELLIGMDVISGGDFAVSTHRGKTTFTFRMPSMEEINFVGTVNYGSEPDQVRKVGRNEKCPCGSGKKYKRCHGAN